MEHLGIKRESFNEDSDFHVDLYTDPLDHRQFIDFLLDEFEIEVTDEEMDDVLIFRDLVDLIESKTR